jgi:DNA helicase-2/ATP-dependent DNA helicase PcrA
MDYVADLHIHSPYSRATSRESTLEGLFAWARVKGIQVVGSGDFTHPRWFERLKTELVPAEPGLFRLRNEEAIPPPLPGISTSPGPVRFLLSAEVSGIYKRHGKVRKVHNLLYVPDFASAERINARLAAIGNIESDGRPILGLDSRNLLEIVLKVAPDGFLVPAHVWTPWFSLFGSRSGFDSLEECFGDLTPHVFALETGLSSDPDMNRLISGLDGLALISNSDCHSPSKLGREANLFSTGFDFFSLRGAIRDNKRGAFPGTIEFFPEEGKYHADGHRACGLSLLPEESGRRGSICPSCGKPLTVGVLHRVMDLADREGPFYPEGAPGFYSMIPLTELIGEIVGAGPSSRGVMSRYAGAINRFGSEFNLLLKAGLEEISLYSSLLGEAVRRVREGDVTRRPGFDGVYGDIRVFKDGELERLYNKVEYVGDPLRRKGKRSG